MTFFAEVIDVGYDYGAEGGPAFRTGVVPTGSGLEVRNALREHPQRRYQLGNRTVGSEYHDYLLGFFEHKRGQLHSFLHRDWNDYRARNEILVLDGEETVQLTKTRGTVEPYVRPITKPDVGTVVIEQLDGSDWVALVENTHYTVDPDTGVITWLDSPYPDSGDQIRWSGEFWVHTRFGRDDFPAQFVGYEERDPEPQLAYQISSLPLVEVLGDPKGPAE